MKYYLDTEFAEGYRRPLFGKNRHFIDLISIGIVAEDGHEYYAISKDFNLKAAWNEYDLNPDIDNGGMKKVYWLRENVLKPIFEELLYSGHKRANLEIPKIELSDNRFTLKNFKKLINGFGKSNKQIRQGIINFVCDYQKASEYAGVGQLDHGYEMYLKNNPPEFYGYYADYDWVVFCSLFGRMLDLPKGFPMYCKDLKQMFDAKAASFNRSDFFTAFDFEGNNLPELSIDEKIKHLKMHVRYPSQVNEHNALADAKWNKQLHEFINNL